MEHKVVELKQTYKLCPNCSFFCHILEKDKYCSLCGSKLIENCPTCLENISNPYAKYCKQCGTAYPGKIKTNKQSF